jgi:hypothetical protein
MLVSKAPVTLTIHWERGGGACTAQWWFGSQCVRTVTPGQA